MLIVLTDVVKSVCVCVFVVFAVINDRTFIFTLFRLNINLNSQTFDLDVSKY